MLVRKDSSVETIAAFTEQSRKQGCNKHCLREKKRMVKKREEVAMLRGEVREREKEKYLGLTHHLHLILHLNLIVFFILHYLKNKKNLYTSNSDECFLPINLSGET